MCSESRVQSGCSLAASSLVLQLTTVSLDLKGKKGLPGSIIKETGPHSFKVKLEDGKMVHCHQDQLRKCFIDENIITREPPLLTDDDLTIFTGSETRPVVVMSRQSSTTECCYPSPIHYRDQTTS